MKLLTSMQASGTEQQFRSQLLCEDAPFVFDREDLSYPFSISSLRFSCCSELLQSSSITREILN